MFCSVKRLGQLTEIKVHAFKAMLDICYTQAYTERLNLQVGMWL